MAVQAASIQEYLDGMPVDRRESVEAIRAAILEVLPEGYEEGMQYGMISYYVPHSIFPAGYHCDPKQPLNFASIGNVKGHIGIHLFCVYIDPEAEAEFKEAWAKTGKKLDMGKACVRVKCSEGVAMDALKGLIARSTVEVFLSNYTAILATGKKK